MVTGPQLGDKIYVLGSDGRLQMELTAHGATAQVDMVSLAARYTRCVTNRAVTHIKVTKI